MTEPQATPEKSPLAVSIATRYVEMYDAADQHDEPVDEPDHDDVDILARAVLALHAENEKLRAKVTALEGIIEEHRQLAWERSERD